ncbi:ATP-binding protein [Erwinia aphidicola]|jgi:signal transduction histidine kinase|uniref:ATP-binding protein n=1 Tax=Erwinia aphidicola TaxID=68334 RepID=UPI0017479C26|nr:ATP-binding protein [Erwinia aphidicola]MBD1376894.1 two-component sensor histidine kinase [Erwinia aphidicola]CAH0261460.1 Signal transduction histidine-protein kinase BaeS [Erwinia aphidicola]
MNSKHYPSLWRWICIRILALAIGSVIVIAFCMWLRFAIENLWVLHHMSPALRAEFYVLRDNPELNLARFHQIVDAGWGARYSDPSIASADWMMVGILVVVVIPFIVFFGLKAARPLSSQFSELAQVAKAVARGDFSTRARSVKYAPSELVQFTDDFNAMMLQLSRYERELRASHVAMAHELRSPLTAAVGRLQGMLDEVFQPEPRQLQMVMKQLLHLNRLIDELHLLSLADAGQLNLDKTPVDLTELLRERAAWLSPQTTPIGFDIRLGQSSVCSYTGDPFRLGQVFTILMENALRYAAEGQRLEINLVKRHEGYDVIFEDFGPGVGSEFLPLMFERFTREEASRARHSGGSGLGLSIARAVCEAHGGSIRADQKAQGGLIITLTLT